MSSPPPFFLLLLKLMYDDIFFSRVRDNFEAAEGVNISRSSIYSTYLEYAAGVDIEPVNTASFGKLMRTVFPQLSTRRLGVRGQSK